MNKIIMLGTGNGFVFDLYNTCFVIQNDIGNLLVDTGGSIDIIKRLKQNNIGLTDINHIFISHSHTDHILGFIWIFKKLWGLKRAGKINENINVYCNDSVYEAINEIVKQVFPGDFVDLVKTIINFHILEDNEILNINGIDYKFFDTHAKANKLYGFEANIDGKRLVFVGDETLDSLMYDHLINADYVMHEAFCLDSEANIFHPYEKNHSTVKSVSNSLNNLNIKNLILFHTEDSHMDNKKELYEDEAKKYFDGNVIVPNDMEIIDI